MFSSPRAFVLALAACAMASGCAQWQPARGPDALGAMLDDQALALDDRWIAGCLSVLGDGTPAPAAGRRSVPSPRPVLLASYDEPLEEPAMPPAEGDPAEPLPTPVVAAPIPKPTPSLASLEAPAERSAIKAPPVPATKPAEPATDLTARDACCCGDGPDCPIAANCPIHGMCGWCTGCLLGGRCHKLFTRPEPGPPPIRYRPPMPPKFLPVPTQPALAPARPDAPDPWRGDVEVGWRPQLTFPARD